MQRDTGEAENMPVWSEIKWWLRHIDQTIAQKQQQNIVITIPHIDLWSQGSSVPIELVFQRHNAALSNQFMGDPHPRSVNEG